MGPNVLQITPTNHLRYLEATLLQLFLSPPSPPNIPPTHRFDSYMSLCATDVARFNLFQPAPYLALLPQLVSTNCSNSEYNAAT